MNILLLDLQIHFLSLLEDFSILFRVHPRLVGKAEGSAVGITGVVEVDSIVSADLFHRHFKGNGLGIEVSRGMCASGQGPDDIGLCILGIGDNVDVGDGMVPECVAGCGRGEEFGQGAGEPVLFKSL